MLAYLCKTNFDFVLNRFTARLRAAARAGKAKNVAIQEELALLRHLRLSADQLVAVLNEVVGTTCPGGSNENDTSVFVSAVGETVADGVHGAIWNWIEHTPAQFVACHLEDSPGP